MSNLDLFVGFALNFLIAVAIVRFIYYPIKHDRNYVFTFLVFNTVIYFVMSILANTQLGGWCGLWSFCHLFRLALSYQSDVDPRNDLSVCRHCTAGHESRT